MRVGIVGAGIAGLAAAKVLTRAGFEVTVFDRTPDVGGVWSVTRRYPGLRTQNSKLTYRFSDFPMPESFPMWPQSAQMQDYLAAYVAFFGFGDRIRLNTEVEAAQPVAAGGWTLRVRDIRSGEQSSVDCEQLVVANGVFCDPAVPDFPGADTFTAVGGRVCHASQFHDLDDARGKHIVVVGYGKSACDIAESVSEVAASTTVVARRLLWKMPRTIRGMGGYEQLALTRMGEAGFPYLDPTGFERFLQGRGRKVRDRMFDLLRWRVTEALGLRELGLVPDGRFEEIAQSTLSLVTEGFYEKVADGRITVQRDASIAKLIGDTDGPAVDLSTEQRLRADVILCATGFHQRVPFFDADVQAELLDDKGDFRLYRQILPSGVPNLTFAGYNSSTLSSLNAEIAALWIAGLLSGRIDLPPKDEREKWISRRLHWMSERTGGHHAHGTSVAPFSIHNVDELLNDLGINLSRFARLRQWFSPIDPAAYANLMLRDSHDSRDR